MGIDTVRAVFYLGRMAAHHEGREETAMATRVTQIPDRWLQGATRVREQQGMAPLAALASAVALWHEQEQLAAQYAAEHAAR